MKESSGKSSFFCCVRREQGVCLRNWSEETHSRWLNHLCFHSILRVHFHEVMLLRLTGFTADIWVKTYRDQLEKQAQLLWSWEKQSYAKSPKHLSSLCLPYFLSCSFCTLFFFQNGLPQESKTSWTKKISISPLLSKSYRCLDLVIFCFVMHHTVTFKRQMVFLGHSMTQRFSAALTWFCSVCEGAAGRRRVTAVMFISAKRWLEPVWTHKKRKQMNHWVFCHKQLFSTLTEIHS